MSDHEHDDNEPHIHVLGAFDPVGSMVEIMNNFMELVTTFDANPEAMPGEEFLRAAHIAHESMEALQMLTFSMMMGPALKAIPEEIREAHFAEVREQARERTPEDQLKFVISLLQRITHHIDLSELGLDDMPDFIPDSFLAGGDASAGSGVDAMKAALARALGKSPAAPKKPDLSKLAPDEPAHPCELCGENKLTKLAENGIHDLWKCACGFTHTSEDCCDRRS